MRPAVINQLEMDLWMYGYCFYTVTDDPEIFAIERHTHPVAADYEIYI